MYCIIITIIIIINIIIIITIVTVYVYVYSTCTDLVEKRVRLPQGHMTLMLCLHQYL